MYKLFLSEIFKSITESLDERVCTVCISIRVAIQSEDVQENIQVFKSIGFDVIKSQLKETIEQVPSDKLSLNVRSLYFFNGLIKVLNQDVSCQIYFRANKDDLTDR